MTAAKMEELRWTVLRSGFPFAVPEKVLGTIKSLDRAAAEKLAKQVFGANVVIRPATSSDEQQPGSTPESAAVHAALVRAQMRRMTVAEVQMARALGVIPFPGGRHRGTVRRLHAESFKPAPEISDELSAVLKACVRVMASKLPPEVVEMAGGGR